MTSSTELPFAEVSCHGVEKCSVVGRNVMTSSCVLARFEVFCHEVELRNEPRCIGVSSSRDVNCCGVS